MKKILVFYWYVHPGWHWVYSFHIEKLKQYCSVFDNVKFIISVDDITLPMRVNYVLERMKEACPNMTYEFFRNDKDSRESKFFYEEIVARMGEFGDDEAIFFAHNKGVFSTYVNKTQLERWIREMYDNNLSDMDKISAMLEDENVCCIGTRLKHFVPPQMGKYAKYKWHYSGTFFWMVPKRIDKYAKENNIPIVKNKGRWYAEGFFSTILPNDNIHVKVV